MSSITTVIDEQKLMKIINDSNSRRRKGAGNLVGTPEIGFTSCLSGVKSQENSRHVSRANSRTNLHRSRASIGVEQSATVINLEPYNSLHQKSLAPQSELPKNLGRRESGPRNPAHCSFSHHTSVTSSKYHSKEGSKRVS